MTVKLLTEQYLELLSLKGGGGAAQARLSVHLSKYHIVGNHMSWLNIYDFLHCQSTRLGVSDPQRVKSTDLLSMVEEYFNTGNFQCQFSFFVYAFCKPS